MTPHTDGELDQRMVGEIAATWPGATAVFRRFGMEFCCHGDLPLAQAAERRGVDPAAVIRALEALDDPLEPVAASYDTASLIDHIISRYHETHRREFGELVRLAKTVEAVHADDPEVPHGLFALLQRMRGEMEVHMKKEELLLFPAMRRGQDAELGRLIAQMRHDHDDHSAYLHELKRLTNTFEPPQWACRSWRALYGGAAKLADDLVEHVHLENNVLFARFQEGSAS